MGPETQTLATTTSNTSTEISNAFTGSYTLRQTDQTSTHEDVTNSLTLYDGDGSSIGTYTSSYDDSVSVSSAETGNSFTGSYTLDQQSSESSSLVHNVSFDNYGDMAVGFANSYDYDNDGLYFYAGNNGYSFSYAETNNTTSTTSETGNHITGDYTQTATTTETITNPQNVTFLNNGGYGQDASPSATNSEVTTTTATLSGNDFTGNYTLDQTSTDSTSLTQSDTINESFTQPYSMTATANDSTYFHQVGNTVNGGYTITDGSETQNYTFIEDQQDYGFSVSFTGEAWPRLGLRRIRSQVPATK